MVTPRLAEGNGLDLTGADAFGRWHRQNWSKAAALALTTSQLHLIVPAGTSRTGVSGMTVHIPHLPGHGEEATP